MAGFDRRVAWHRSAAIACLGLLCAHALLTTVGYALGDRLGLPAEIGRLVNGYPGVITAAAGLALLIVVAATSAGRLRRRLRYETWHFTHLYAYVAVALGLQPPDSPRAATSWAPPAPACTGPACTW